MAIPSDKYAVDYTDSLGLKWSKALNVMYPSLGVMDESIGYSRYNNNIVKNIYRKVSSYMNLYDNSYTFASDFASPYVWKYFSRSGTPVDSVNINTIIVNDNNEDSDYVIGVDSESSNPYGALANGRILVDANINNILIKSPGIRRFKNFTAGTNIIQGYAWEYSNGSNWEDTDLAHLNDNDYCAIYYSYGAKVWNGSSWSDTTLRPALLCSGDTVQSVQGAGSAFTNTYVTGNMKLGSGENVSVTANTNSAFWNGYNFQNRMLSWRYALGFTDEIEFKPDFAADTDAKKADIKNYLINNCSPNTNINLSLERKIIEKDTHLIVLLEIYGQFYYDNSQNVYCNWMSYNATPCIKGKSLSAFIAGFGLYYLSDNSASLSGITPNNLGDSNKIWLGEMSADGTTTGNWVKGSDINSYTGYNKDGNIINPDYDPAGGGGGGGGGYDDDPWSGATFAGTGVGGAGAFAKVYYMTSTELANLRSWMNSINVPEGFDPMQQIIGLSQVPVALSGSGPENVVFVNSSAVYDPGVTTRAVDTGVATQQAMGTPISYYLGSVNISRRMQQRGEPYLDYDCQIELYLPLIGMFSLDTQAVMGRTISAYAVLDPVSGTLAAYAYVSKDGQNLPIAYGSTTIGVDLPISAQQLSISRAALKQANAQLGASLLSGALTMLAAASTGGKSSGSGAKTSTGSSGLSAAGIREAGSDYMKASQVGNVFGDFMNWGRTIRQLSYGNNTAVAGSFGGSTAQWSYPFTPYVKIIRPRYEKPSNYAHSQGVPCVQTKTIGSCTGFIQCIGADVSGITGATDLELQAIQAALSNGIYAGGGQ